MSPKNHARAVRYRQLALVEPDKAKAAVLSRLPMKPTGTCCVRSIAQI
jgi:hypothetical protein